MSLVHRHGGWEGPREVILGGGKRLSQLLLPIIIFNLLSKILKEDLLGHYLQQCHLYYKPDNYSTDPSTHTQI